MKVIEEFFRTKEEAIRNKDIELYMSTISECDELYRNEQGYWIRDMIKDEITNVSFTVKNIEKLDTEYRVLINQQHFLNDKKMDFDYVLLLKYEGEEIKDYGFYFNVIDRGNFLVKYVKDAENAHATADAISGALEDLKSLFDVELEQLLEIKLYPELDLVRQRSGPSYNWKFPLWAAPNQAIKIYQYMYPDPSQLIGGIQHEIIHILTIKGNTQNFMSWMAEGIALKYGNDRYDLRDIDFSLQYIDEQDLAVPLAELMKMKLSDYTEMKDITKYYNICFKYFDYLDTISNPREIFRLFDYIGNHNPINNERELEQVADKAFNSILGISLNELSNEYLKWYQEQKR